jgi:uncharacterized protein GlcG (DUF336 family)
LSRQILRRGALARRLVIWGVCVPGSVLGASSPLVPVDTLSQETALTAVRVATQSCAEAGFHVSTAVVGRDGRLVAFVRMPLAGPHTIEVAQRKAYTALTYQIATAAMMGRAHLSNTPGVLLIGGGLPISAGGRVVGAIGVSGAPGRERPGDQDEECARSGIAAIAEALEFAD